MTQQEQTVATANTHAWRNAVIAGVGSWCLLAVAVAALMRNPMFTLSFVGPVCVGIAAAALLAGRTRARWSAAAYPVVVLGVAALVNAPVLDLLL